MLRRDGRPLPERTVESGDVSTEPSIRRTTRLPVRVILGNSVSGYGFFRELVGMKRAGALRRPRLKVLKKKKRIKP
jgi:hypothetical protein